MDTNLPELGTKAAAVAGIESLIFTAIRVPGALEPERLRYWLDAYYQVRRLQEDEEAQPKIRSSLKLGPDGLGVATVEEVKGAEQSAPP